jgi:endonuclease/exonuclease/phosphatase family metal-dependent hydrolase
MMKVMTLNINYYHDKHGSWEARKELICAAIRAADPDVIALQAVRRDQTVSQGEDQATQLARLLPVYQRAVFQPAVTYEDGAAEGSAFLSRLEILELSVIPGLEDTNQRIVLNALIDRPSGPLRLFNAHFSWVYEQGQRNIRETLPYLNSFSESAMLVGDFNIAPDNDLLKRFHEEGWVDVWAELRPEEQGYTFVENKRLANRIDYAWLKRELLRSVQDIAIVADNQDEKGRRPSDHVGLLVTL